MNIIRNILVCIIIFLLILAVVKEHFEPKLSRLEEETETKIQAVDDKIAGVHDKIKAATDKIGIVDNSIKAFEKKLDGFDNGLKSFEDKVEKLYVQVRTLDKKIKDTSGNKVKSAVSQNGIKGTASHGTVSSNSDLSRATKIFHHEAIQILSGQVLIKLKDLSIGSYTYPSASFEVTLPSMERKEWTGMTEGTRRQFEYNGRTYFFELMGIGNHWAIFEIKTRLA